MLKKFGLVLLDLVLIMLIMAKSEDFLLESDSNFAILGVFFIIYSLYIIFVVHTVKFVYLLIKEIEQS